MNVLFLSLGEFDNLEDGSVHIDLLKEFATHHNVYLICKRERKNGHKTELSVEHGIHILRVKTGNLKDTSLLEKGLSTILVEGQFKNAIKNQFREVKFDLVIYTTPPITFADAVKFAKNRDKASTYLLLKDIFPQNAVDIGMMKKTGIKGLIYYYFRAKEKELYSVSDYIGCMSIKNCEYLLSNNPDIPIAKVHVCPNSIRIVDKSLNHNSILEIRTKYNIPTDKKVFVYGGNLGKPQGIPFLLECLEKCKQIKNCFFLIVGDGTEYDFISENIEKKSLHNVRIMRNLPKKDYDTLVGGCDAGLIFLDYRFSIPNFPSRILSYLQAKIPVIACTDPNTDLGETISNGGFGWWCLSNDSNAFLKIVENAMEENLKDKGEVGYQYLVDHWDISKQYQTIIDTIS